MTKKRPCKQSRFTKRELLNEIPAKKSTNTQKNEFWQAAYALILRETQLGLQIISLSYRNPTGNFL
jgi:hypothetical protein